MKLFKYYFSVFFLMLIFALQCQTTSGLVRHAENSKYCKVLLKSNDLKNILGAVEKDTLLQMERFAAFLFHKLINQYRTSKKLNPLKWDEKLWLAARNHCLYLCANSLEITHDQVSTRPFYTGDNFLKRIDYVQKQKSIGNGGENVVKVQFYCDDPIDKLINIAIDRWAGSHFHNLAMINVRYKSHGTAFYFDANRNLMVGTTVFTSLINNDPVISITWSNEIKKKYANYRYLPKPQQKK